MAGNKEKTQSCSGVNPLVMTETEDGVAVVKINNPPVNALGPGVAEGLEDAIQLAEADGAVRAIVLMGAGKTFVAGADVTQLEDLAWGRGLARRIFTICCGESKTARNQSSWRYMGRRLVAALSWLWPAIIALLRDRPESA